MVSFSQTISHWLAQSHGLANQVALHAAEVWLLAESYPHLYGAELIRRWGSKSFDKTQTDEPEFSGPGRWEGGMKDFKGTNRKQKNLRIGNRNHLNKKIENHREPKHKYGIETKRSGIVTWRNCNAPPITYTFYSKDTTGQILPLHAM